MVSRGDIGTRRSRAPPRDGRPWRSAAFAVLAALLLHAAPACDAYELACQPEGSVTTVAGDGTPGFRDGLQERSAFRAPSGVAVRAATGDVYVADSGNHRIRKVTSLNQVSTVAGVGVAGWVDGPASRARLSDPRGLAFGPDGSLFVADAGNHRIRVVDLDIRAVATYAGSGGDGYLDSEDPLVAHIRAPTGLAFHDASRVLYVTDGDGRVRGVRGRGDPNGAGVFTVANAAGRRGFIDSPDGALAAFNTPSFMAFDENQATLYIADRHNHAVRALDVATRAVTTAAGGGAPPSRGSSLAADGARGGPVLPGGEYGVRFHEPVGVAFFLEPRGVGDGGAGGGERDPGAGRRALLVTESATNRVRRVALEGNVTGSEGVFDAASFPYAGSYAAASGHRDELGQAAMFAAPAGVAVAPAAGAAAGAAAYVCDAGNHVVRRLERRLPTRVRVSVSAVSETSDAQLGSFVEDAVAREYGYYSVNGPPNNETTHLADALRYRGETHDATMCAYPGQEYFFHFKGALRAVVADEALFLAKNVTARTAYVAWQGAGVDDERSENVKLRGGGCTDPRAPNYDAWADREDGSCARGVVVSITVTSLGAFGVYQIEGPGVYYTEEVAPLEEEDEEDDVHELVFGAYPQAAYTIQLHGALKAVVADAPGQETNFTYLNHTSRNANSHRIEVFRPAGAGCTRSAFINYSPFATSDDGTCAEGAFLRVDSAAADATSQNETADDWYEFGVVNALQPLLLGGQAVLTPVLFTAGNVTAQQTVYVAPGRFPVHVFGGARATFTEVTASGSEVLLSADGENASARVDEHGFNSTLGDALFFLTVLGKDDADEDASPDATVTGTGADATITGLTVANLSSSAAAAARNDPVAAGAPAGAWDFLALVWQASPLRLKLDVPAKVTFPYDAAKLPTVKGNDELVAVRASDLTASDWRVVPGATFDALAETVTARVDVFSLFSVAARASARAVRPARVRHTGGALITLDGVDFKVPPVYNATGSVFCKFGELFTKAEWVASGDPRGFGDAARCATPAVSHAGFVSVEFYDAGTYQNSASDLRVLFTAPPSVARVAPSSGPDTGAALVTLAGAAFARFGSLDGTRDEISCRFGDFGDFGDAAPGVAVSSAVALCETPAADAKRHTEVRVGVASDGAHDARTAAYRYRVSLADAVFPAGGAGAPGEALGDARELFGVGAGGAVVDARLGTVRGALAREAKCAFGAVAVAARRVSENGEGIHCVTPAGAGRKTVALVASLAEPGARLAAFQYVEEEDLYGSLGGPSPQSRARANGEGFSASLFVDDDGRYGARLDAAIGVPASVARVASARMIAREKNLRCALGGVAAATELARVSKALSAVVSRGEDVGETPSDAKESGEPPSVVLSCSPTRGTPASGFVAVAFALRGADESAAGAVFAVVSVPSHPPRFRGILGGAHVPAAAGAHVWLAGAHLLPNGGGGSWPGTASGFGWGTGGDVTCVSARVDETPRVVGGTTQTTQTTLPSHSGAARFVSSALVACEVPDAFTLGDGATEDDRFSGFTEAAVRLRVAVAEHDGGASAATYRDAPEDANVVARAVRRVVASSATGHAFLPAEGGAAVRVAWHGVGSLGDAPRDPNWLACAFGATAPVAMRAEAAAGGENAGVCASPARAPARADRTANPSGRGSFAAGISDFGVAYPNFGRAFLRVEPEAEASAEASTRGTVIQAVATASARLWAPLASAVPRSGGAEVRVVGMPLGSAAAGSLHASCAFGTTRSAATQTTTKAGFVSFSCASPRVSRGGFSTLRVGPRADFMGLMGHGHVLLAYAVPVVTSTAPRSVPERGGSVVFVAGSDFPGDAARDSRDSGGAAARCAFVLASAARRGAPAPFFAVEAAAVSSALTRCEMPPVSTLGTLADDETERANEAETETERGVFADVSVARGADFASARAAPSGVAVAAHVSPRAAAARPPAAPADDGGTLVTVLAKGFSKQQTAADACAFGAVSVRANPVLDEEATDFFSFECAAPTRARGAAPVALAREWHVTFDAHVQVTFL